MSLSDRPVLLISGEVSGDRIGASVVRALRRRGVSSFGLGGRASAAAGMQLTYDLAAAASMGSLETFRRAPALTDAFARLLWTAILRRPKIAILIGFSELNVHLGRALRRAGVYVLWCSAPQVWAWRPGRIEALRSSVDALALLLPFEVAIWKNAGYLAEYVGHPALDGIPRSREQARTLLQLTKRSECIALLPGSRAQEVQQHAEPMLRAYAHLRGDRGAIDARLFLAPSLRPPVANRVSELASVFGVPIVNVDPSEGLAPALSAFDAAFACSGTVTLECALARAWPVVIYRTGWVTHAIARRLVTVPYVALPNVILGEGVFPELLQTDVDPTRMAHEMGRVLDHQSRFDLPRSKLKHALCPQGLDLDGGSVGDRVVAFLERHA